MLCDTLAREVVFEVAVSFAKDFACTIETPVFSYDTLAVTQIIMYNGTDLYSFGVSITQEE